MSRRAELTQARAKRRRSGRRLLGIAAVLFAAVLAVVAWLVVVPIYHYLHPADYTGAGTGTVTVTVQAGESVSDMAATLHSHGVVASTRAFTDAANGNAQSTSIQAGTYVLHRHMSAASALRALLNPATRSRTDTLVVAEGATVLDVAARLQAPRCASVAKPSCGPGLSAASVQRALRDVPALGLPTEYTVAGKAPSSAEGFLFPATYTLSGHTDAAAALQPMVSSFTDAVRSVNFTARAAALHLTPYQALIVASIAQAEAKFPADYPKVARVILNRLTAGRPLQIDATSAYAAKLAHLDPAKVAYATINSPYNTYTHGGLPPTPIGNPGVPALTGASSPAAGDWLYYVNGDAAGHLFFTNSEKAFAKAVATCTANHWGCG